MSRARLATLPNRLATTRRAAPWGGDSQERGTRQQRGYGAAWDRLRLCILKRDYHLCQPCLRAERISHASIVDHVTPKAEGGSDEPDNLQTICADCHRVKTQAEANRSRLTA
jgi:5-methylcytosine-specific restriction protein A